MQIILVQSFCLLVTLTSIQLLVDSFLTLEFHIYLYYNHVEYQTNSKRVLVLLKLSVIVKDYNVAAFWLVKYSTVVHIFVQLKKKNKLVLYILCAVLWGNFGSKRITVYTSCSVQKPQEEWYSLITCMGYIGTMCVPLQRVCFFPCFDHKNRYFGHNRVWFLHSGFFWVGCGF